MSSVHYTRYYKKKRSTQSSIESILMSYVEQQLFSLLFLVLLFGEVVTGSHVLRCLTFGIIPRILVRVFESLLFLHVSICVVVDFVRNLSLKFEPEEKRMFEPTWKRKFANSVYRACDCVGLTDLIEKKAPLAQSMLKAGRRASHLRSDYDYVSYDQIRPFCYNPYGQNVFRGDDELDVSCDSEYQNCTKVYCQSFSEVLNDSATLNLSNTIQYFEQNQSEHPFNYAALQSYDAMVMDVYGNNRGSQVPLGGSVADKDSQNGDPVYPNDPRAVRLPILDFFMKCGLNETDVVDVQNYVYEQFLKIIVRPLIREIDRLNVELSKDFNLSIGRSSLEVMRNAVPKRSSVMMSLSYVLEYLTVHPDYLYVYALLCELARTPTAPIRLPQERNDGLKEFEKPKNREEVMFRLFCVFMNNEKYRSGLNLLGKSSSAFTDEHVRTVSADTQIQNTPITEKGQVIVLEDANGVKFRFQVYNQDYIVSHSTSSSMLAISMFLVYSASCDGFCDVISGFRLQPYLSHRNFD